MQLLRRLSPVVVGLLLSLATFALGALISTVRPPVPSVHDEFSYLLAGDTFAHGRLTNPTPECWARFESFHIIFEPSYASKYPPLPGMFLAIGQVAGGDPIAGVWLMQAVATACCYWMLLGWMPRRWADLTAIVLVLHPSIQLLWGQSLWGGAAGFAAGALVWGAVPRLAREPSRSAAAVMAVGTAMLAISRPYEGLVTVVVAVVSLLVWWSRTAWPDLQAFCFRVLLPQVCVMLPAITLIGIYNNAVTGSPLRLPYMVHEETYAMSPNFVGQSPTTDRTYRHAVIERFHREWAMDWYEQQDTLGEFVALKRKMSAVNAQFFMTAPLAMPLLLLPVWRGRKIWVAFGALAIGWAASMLTIWSWPHYLAPSACLVLVVIGWGLRNVHAAPRVWLHQRTCDRRWVPVASLLVLLHSLVFGGSVSMHLRKGTNDWQHRRAELNEMLRDSGQRHLVIVDYADNHHTPQEWVYNDADLESAPVIWARLGDRDEVSQLIDHYDGRLIWRLEPDVIPPRLTPFDSPLTDGAIPMQAGTSAIGR